MRELGTFSVVYPCWALVHKNSFRKDEAGRLVYNPPIQFLVLAEADGAGTVPIFSDGDLAARFKTDSGGYDDFVTLKIPTVEMLVSILKQNRKAADAMSFDQPKMGAKPFAIWPLDYAIQKLEAGEDL